MTALARSTAGEPSEEALHVAGLAGQTAPPSGADVDFERDEQGSNP
jgi:hypothetical protein